MSYHIFTDLTAALDYMVETEMWTWPDAEVKAVVGKPTIRRLNYHSALNISHDLSRRLLAGLALSTPASAIITLNGGVAKTDELIAALPALDRYYSPTGITVFFAFTWLGRNSGRFDVRYKDDRVIIFVFPYAYPFVELLRSGRVNPLDAKRNPGGLQAMLALRGVTRA